MYATRKGAVCVLCKALQGKTIRSGLLISGLVLLSKLPSLINRHLLIGLVSVLLFPLKWKGNSNGLLIRTEQTRNVFASSHIQREGIFQFCDAMGEDANLLEKTGTRQTRGVTDAKFRVFLSLKPWQNRQTQNSTHPDPPIPFTTTTGTNSPLSHPLRATSPHPPYSHHTTSLTCHT